jgi:septum site-determining protein MinD
MPRIIGILSGKGGVGKTTVVTNLSTALATTFDKKVTVIDCNVTTSHLAMHFGMLDYPITLNHVLRGEARIEDAIFKHDTGVQIVPASLNLSDLVGVDVVMLANKISNSFQYEDFVLLDLAPGFGKEAVAAMKACKEAIIVTTPDIPAVTDVIRGKKVLEELKVDVLGVVLNMVTGKKFELMRSEIMKLVDLPILAEIPFSEKFRESLAAKIPLVLYDRTSPATIGFLELASLLTGEPYQLPKMSFLEKLRKIFSRFS